MSFLAYQKLVRDLLLAREMNPSDVQALGGHGHWSAYRRMARSRFYETIDHAFEGLIQVIGRKRLHLVVDRFLAEESPRSAYLRDLPGEFLRFGEAHGAELSAEFAWPPWALDLARYEWAELDAAYAADEVRPEEVIAFTMDRVAVLSPSARILLLQFPVHQIEGDGATLAAAPVALCRYRDPHTHEVETLELTPLAGQILQRMGRRSAPFAQIVRNVADDAGVEVDITFVEALSTLLADLVERGVLLGSLADPEK